MSKNGVATPKRADSESGWCEAYTKSHGQEGGASPSQFRGCLTTVIDLRCLRGRQVASVAAAPFKQCPTALFFGSELPFAIMCKRFDEEATLAKKHSPVLFVSCTAKMILETGNKF